MSQALVNSSMLAIDAFASPASSRGDGHRVFRNRAIDFYVDQAARNHPRKTAIIDRFGSLTWSEVELLTRRLAAGLEALGVKPGDRVAVQLPNWRHFPLLEYALSRLGAICVPLPAIYRERELKFMLGLTEPVLAVVPDTFRGFDHASMMAELMPALPSLRRVVVVGRATLPHEIPFEELLSASLFEGASRTHPDAVTEIVFTSGTTGEPKGVMHSSNSNMCPLFNLIDEQQLTSQESILMGSTFGHQTGFVYGGQLPAVLGGTLVLMDQWDPREAIALIEKERITWTMSATPFLQDLVEHGSRKALASLRTFLCSGAPIPSSLLAAARTRTDAAIVSGWGMTEVGLVTLSKRADDDDRIANSDGKAFDAMAIRIVDEQGEQVLVGEEGDLLRNGPSMFLGYYRRPDFVAEAFAGGNWLRTGDRGRVDEQGYLRIVGRSKDIIIRGGENIPVVEVENLLRQHPAVERVAIVAVPDPRMQERACAVVVLRSSEKLSFEDMRDHLLQFKLARQYIPEHLVVMDSLPMTPSGKVQKYVLRARIKELLACPGEDRHAQAA